MTLTIICGVIWGAGGKIAAREAWAARLAVRELKRLRQESNQQGTIK